jgi:hypothetical protein
MRKTYQNVDVLAGAVVKRAYDDYKNCLQAVLRDEKKIEKARENNNSRQELAAEKSLTGHKEDLKVIERELTGKGVQMWLDAMEIKESPEELKRKFDEHHPDLFYVQPAVVNSEPSLRDDSDKPKEEQDKELDDEPER